MLSKKIIEVNELLSKAHSQNLDFFKFSAKSGRKFIVRQQYNEFNIYTNSNKLIANNISNVEDLANCMTMIANTKQVKQ